VFAGMVGVVRRVRVWEEMVSFAPVTFAPVAP
jgi:hypothetical protein